jgi:hypothetical protein
MASVGSGMRSSFDKTLEGEHFNRYESSGGWDKL